MLHPMPAPQQTRRPDDTPPRAARLAEIGGVFLRLGLISFGGPVAHLGYFRAELVQRRRWLTDAAYAELVALCQSLPGPTSSQVGFALGLQRGGWAGAALAWAGFTLPSAVLLILLALGLGQLDLRQPAVGGALHGLKIAAVAVVAHAVWGMARTLCPDMPRRALALAVTALAWVWGGAWAQVCVIFGAMALGALVGGTPARARPVAGTSATAQPDPQTTAATATTPASAATARREAARAGAIWLLLFAALLIGLPALAHATGSAAAELAAVFYKTGALVFGGGHVVLPLLQAEAVPRGWLPLDSFLAGYGAAQAVPGPLFTFAAFVGAARSHAPNGWAGGLLALLVVFLPGFLLLLAALPLWAQWRHQPRARHALAAVNAAVVGLLLATWLSLLGASIQHAGDVLTAVLATLALLNARMPPWAVTLACALVGAAVPGFAGA